MADSKSIRVNAEVRARLLAIKHELEHDRSKPVSMSIVIAHLLDNKED